jgi:hypothetical protein
MDLKSLPTFQEKATTCKSTQWLLFEEERLEMLDFDTRLDCSGVEARRKERSNYGTKKPKAGAKK